MVIFVGSIHITLNLTDSSIPLTPSDQWSEGAKALAKFQQEVAGVGQGSTITGGPREGKPYTSLIDITTAVQKATAYGLSHSFSCHGFGDFSHFMLRCTLHHESGESKISEVPIKIPTNGNYTMREQELGGTLTYRRKYLLTGIYGIASDPGLDPDRQSFNTEDIALQQPKLQEKAHETVPTPPPAAPVSKADLSPEEHSKAISIIKKHPEAKVRFIENFYPQMTRKLNTEDICLRDHLQFLLQVDQILTAEAQETSDCPPF